MANFLGQKTRVEFNGHDVSHITGCSIGSMGKVFDTFQVLTDPYDHDIEITEEASGSFDIIASDDSTSGIQRFKEMMQLVRGYVDLDGPAAGTALANGDASDSIGFTDEDWTDPDTQGDYTGSRYTTVYKRIAEADASIAFDADADTIWVRFKAQGENIDTVAFAMTSSGGSGANNASMQVDVYDELSFGNNQIGESITLASGGSTTTLVDAGILTAADNSFIGATVKFLSGANKGFVRTVTDSVSSTATVTFDAVPTAVASGDRYMISGVPSNTATGSFAITEFQVLQSVFNAANKWAVVGPSTLGTTWTGGDDLTIGKYYWLRLNRLDTDGNEASVRVTNTADKLKVGHLHLRAESTNPLVDSYAANTEAIHYIKFKTTEGLKVDVYDYVDAAESSGIKYTFNKVELDSTSPSFANKQATRASISWKCNDWSLTGI